MPPCHLRPPVLSDHIHLAIWVVIIFKFYCTYLLGLECSRRLKSTPTVWELQYCKWHLNCHKCQLTEMYQPDDAWSAWRHDNQKMMCGSLAGLPGRSHHISWCDCMAVLESPAWSFPHQVIGSVPNMAKKADRMGREAKFVSRICMMNLSMIGGI